ncbi:MAG TPA: LacI family DNA-binding transcriptional regulator [Polaromonas sp.]|uniref:LacI family DNA-binding transcriptional regulator n=1 Tax=Polaromonas sp. TaxID=1869339 RepID=UPI002D4D624B|nr:LacI family DNA-binding transcriptional regulator [Polaromonas sp.]HYW57400.1 LacI family DNA-binding transcriptional regulator [Polaromonas sp.]
MSAATKYNKRSTGRSTLADVARLAEVTTMTISRYLREPHRVSPPTADKIREALAATGYTPNKQAGGLASGRSPVIAAVIPNIGNTIFAETVQGLCDVFQAVGYELLLSASNYSTAREEELVRAMLGWMPAGLVVTGRRHSAATLQMMRSARDAGTPVIEMWDKDPKPAEFVQIGFNHEAVGALMADHLVEQGYRELLYVDSGVPEDFRAHERGLGFVKRAKRLGCSVSTEVAPRCEPMLAGRQAMAALMTRGLPRAAAFANDHLAVGAYLHAQAQSLVMPGDFAILGFGDFPIAAQLGAGISSVATDRYNIGQATAFRLLHDLGPEAKPVPAHLEGVSGASSYLELSEMRKLNPRVVQRSTS